MMAGVCERCMTREARSAHDLFCDPCEDVLALSRDGRLVAVVAAAVRYLAVDPFENHHVRPGGFAELGRAREALAAAVAALPAETRAALAARGKLE